MITEQRKWRIQNILMALLSFIAVGILLTAFLFKTVILPIRQLAEGMDQVAKGNLNQKIENIRDDEIGSLSRLFNKMTEDIRALVKEQEALVAAEQERTDKLAATNAELVAEIKERRNAEERLNTAYRQFYDIIDFLPDATFVIDSEHKVIAWNRAMEEFSGVPKRDMIGASGYAYAVPFYGVPRPMLIDLIFEPDKNIESQYAFLERKGDHLYAETYLPALKKNGSLVQVWGIASPLYDNSGAIVGAIESIRDITQLKLNEEKVLHAAEEWRITFDSINDLIAIIDRNMCINRCNLAFASAI